MNWTLLLALLTLNSGIALGHHSHTKYKHVVLIVADDLGNESTAESGAWYETTC